MKCPSEIGVAFTLKLDMRALLFGFRNPADPQESAIHTICLAAGERTHKNRMDLGGFPTCSVRSAITRKASAVTAISASSLEPPYAKTPGNSGISAIHRPSTSRSNSMLNDSQLSGGWGAVAIATPVSAEIIWLISRKVNQIRRPGDIKLLILPNRLALLEHCAQTFLRVFQVHKLIQVDVVRAANSLI